MVCFAPLVLLGYALTMQTSWHHSENVNATVVEVQTCEKGIGLDAKASSAGLFGFGLQYGFTLVDVDKYSLTFLPKAGLSYSATPRPELPLQGQFEVGGQFLVGYEDFRVGIEYWHLSNASLKSPNIGLDMLVLQTGWRF